MKRIGFTLAALFTLTGLVAPGLHAQDCEDVSGVWAVDLSLPNASQSVTVTLEQTECGVTGLVTGNNETPIEDGTVEGSTFKFVTNVTNQADGSAIVIAWEGTVEGDAVSGTLTADLMGSVEFSGTRTDS